jgi:hypothetical protein
MGEASIPYNPSNFDASFIGELGRLLNQEKVVNVFQGSRATHHKSKALNFEHRTYVTFIYIYIECMYIHINIWRDKLCE